MKHCTCSLLFALCLFASQLQAQPEFGGRAMLSFIYLGGSAGPDDYYVGITSRFGGQIGASMYNAVSEHIGLTTELNYTLSGYTPSLNFSPSKVQKINYHYLGVTVLPRLNLGEVVSVGIGAAGSLLLNNAGDLSPNSDTKHRPFDLSLVGALGLRHPPFEIQLRYQYALLPFVSDGQEGISFRTVGIGLGYYF